MQKKHKHVKEQCPRCLYAGIQQGIEDPSYWWCSYCGMWMRDSEIIRTLSSNEVRDPKRTDDYKLTDDDRIDLHLFLKKGVCGDETKDKPAG